MHRRRAHAVYTCRQRPVFRRLVASAGSNTGLHRFSLVCWAASGKGRDVSGGGKRGRVGMLGEGGGGGGVRPLVRTRMLTPLINGLGHTTLSSTVPSLSISNAFVLEKSLVYFFEHLLHWSCWYCSDATSLPVVRE